MQSPFAGRRQRARRVRRLVNRPIRLIMPLRASASAVGVGEWAEQAIMGAQRAAKSGRDIVAYFAGHLANLANGNDTLGDAE
jgi:hypothetical protein